MKVTQEKLPASQIGLDIEITPEMSKNAYEQVVQRMSRSVNIPGFRKGKVPRHILIQRLGQERIKAAALDDLMNQYLPKAVEQENIQAIGSFEPRGEIDNLIQQFEPGKTLTIQVAVDVEPEVKLGQYKGLSVQAEEAKYDPEQVEQVLKREQEKRATLIPVEGRPAQEGDVAFVDFQGYFAQESEEAEPKEIPGAKGDNFQVELQEGRFIPGFVEGIFGMNPGETKTLNLRFPDEYGDEEVAGKDATFTITLNELKERELPELDDEFAEEVSEFSTLAELRESLEKRFQGEKDDQTKANKRKALVDALVETLEVDLPETLIRQEVDRLITQQVMQLSNMGLDVKRLFTGEMVPRLREQARPEAIDALKRSLALKAIAEQESLTVKDEEIQAEEAKVLKELEGQDVDPKRLRAFVTEDLLQNKTYTLLEEHATIELVPEGTLTPLEDEEEEDEELDSTEEE
ncbi:Trigger factor [Planktothrix tepida]|uniref:Trigger factor n=1 Tax=Planktothrix tepida PCC 9214 TaxID=671072 RepID=A0A1J1LG15_9CYAN|nr:trigger factor [Planktothrix tepida]CAD5923633.1 Trigger factor [Planktothrix tepida]CUR31118.1 Trigger factor [Planktothrix tepida PCC 9214]